MNSHPLTSEGSASAKDVAGPIVTRDRMGWIIVRDPDGGTLKSQSVEATLLYLILQRLPDPSEPLAEAVEWEMLDGTARTTDKELARNWAGAVGVRVVRRAALTKVGGAA